MRQINFIFALIMSVTLFSCGKTYEFNSKGFGEIHKEITEKFGKDAYFTTISYGKTSENKYVISVDQTNDPEKASTERWVNYGYTWEKIADVNLDIRSGAPIDYMFQLDQQINLEQLGKHITESQAYLKEKNINADQLKIAVISTNNTIIDRNDKYNYTIILEDKSGKSYSYTYGLDGTLKNTTE